MVKNKGLFALLPVPEILLRGHIFTSFMLHLLFVLLTLGTAILGLHYFNDSNCGGRVKELRLDKRILKTFMAHKSLAVVLGIAPLLLIQVGFTIPFFTAVNLFAPYWMLLVVFLIVAFLCFDALGHKIYVHRYIHLAVGVLAIALILEVPGIFVAILTAFEYPDRWQAIMNGGYRLTDALTAHWLFRYLHILGAAIVFGSGFHYFFIAADDTELNSLQKWFVAGILIQFILGILLYGLLPERPDYIITFLLLVGIVVLPLLLFVLVTMLLTRQSFRTELLSRSKNGMNPMP